MDVVVAEFSHAKAQKELCLLNQLLDFYTKIDGIDRIEEGKRMIEIVQEQIGIVKELVALQSTISKQVQYSFERGYFSVGEALEAKKSLSGIKSELSELELMLEHYNRLAERADRKQDVAR